jgi:hypothetical protein
MVLQYSNNLDYLELFGSNSMQRSPQHIHLPIQFMWLCILELSHGPTSWIEQYQHRRTASCFLDAHNGAAVTCSVKISKSIGNFFRLTSSVVVAKQTSNSSKTRCDRSRRNTDHFLSAVHWNYMQSRLDGSADRTNTRFFRLS